MDDTNARKEQGTIIAVGLDGRADLHGTSPDTFDRPGAAGAERFLSSAFVILRVIQLVQAAIVLATNPHSYSPEIGAVLLFAGQLGWSGWLIRQVLRTHAYTRRSWAVTDISVAASEVFILALIAKGPGSETWTNWAFAVGTSAVMGVAVPFKARGALLASLTVAGAHLAGAAHSISQHRASSSNATGNSLSYLGFTLIVILLARQIRKTGQQIDDATDRAITAETKAARTAERLDHYRRLHNGALATLTLIAAGTLDADNQAVRDRARRDADGLRRLIESDPEGRGPTSLGTGLEDLVAQRIAEGMTIHYLSDSLPDDIPPVVEEALFTAVSEALTNVAKHAPEATAHVTAGQEDTCLRVSVYDTGAGFDLTSASPKGGLHHSIRRPIEDIGGTVNLTSGPDGTLVEMTWSPA